jgi:hypothetical protein
MQLPSTRQRLADCQTSLCYPLQSCAAQGQGQPQSSQPGGLVGGADQQSIQGGADAGGGISLPPGHPNYDQMQRFYQQQAASRARTGAAAGGPAADPKPGGGAPGQPDRFGLLGLLSVIRMTDPDLTTLVLVALHVLL